MHVRFVLPFRVCSMSRMLLRIYKFTNGSVCIQCNEPHGTSVITGYNQVFIVLVPVNVASCALQIDFPVQFTKLAGRCINLKGSCSAPFAPIYSRFSKGIKSMILLIHIQESRILQTGHLVQLSKLSCVCLQFIYIDTRTFRFSV
ncbi:hypothetical protein D3C81_1178940 [compost metagenome]